MSPTRQRPSFRTASQEAFGIPREVKRQQMLNLLKQEQVLLAQLAQVKKQMADFEKLF